MPNGFDAAGPASCADRVRRVADVIGEEQAGRRSPWVLVAVVVAFVAAAVGVRLYVTRERPVPAGRTYLVVGGGTQQTNDGKTQGFLVGVRSGWPEPVSVRSVVPLDAAGKEAPHLWARPLDPSIAGQQQMYGMEPHPPLPYLIRPGAEATLALRVPMGCATKVPVTAFLVRLTVPEGETEQVVSLVESNIPVASGTECKPAG